MRKPVPDLLTLQVRLLWLRWISISQAIQALERLDVPRHRTNHELDIPAAE